MNVLDKPAVHKASLLLSDVWRSKTASAFDLTTLTGRVTEFNATQNTPVLSFLSLLIGEAQAKNEPVVWVSANDSIFYPPDFQQNGVDTSVIPVVWCANVRSTVRSTEHLLRSNAFGLIIADLPHHAIIDQGRLGKLSKLADLNSIALILITQHREDTPYTLGSIISLRFTGVRSQIEKDVFTCTLSAIKDKSGKPGWHYSRNFSVPHSLC